MTRYIDADAIVEEMDRYIEQFARLGMVVDGNDCFYKINELLADAPTADVVEVTKTSTDLISRADAIAICHNGKVSCVHDVADELKKLPSAGRPSGEWINVDNYYRLATCSNCQKVTMFEKWGEYTKPYNYCPNCGAKMGSD